MIIFLSELQKEHLKLIAAHSVEVTVEFCKMAIDYLNNGANETNYEKAAGNFNVSSNEIKNIVHAIVFLLVEGCKHNLSEIDFKSSLAIAGFTSEQQEVLLKLYQSKRKELSECLYVLQQTDPCYQDFAWRLEVQVASMQQKEQLKPTVTMDFVLKTPKKFNSGESVDSYKNKSSYNRINVRGSIQDAKTASLCQNEVEHVFVQCDLPNLVHMTNKLEQALKESKSQHVRKVQRVLQ